jgi:hypothetical protein
LACWFHANFSYTFKESFGLSVTLNCKGVPLMSTGHKKKFSLVSKLSLISITLTLSSLEPLHNLDITWETSFHQVPQVIHIGSHKGCLANQTAIVHKKNS